VNGALNSVPIKPQIVRLYDVFVYGPLLLLLATRKRKLADWEKLALLALGAGTVVYNLRNYLAIERQQKGDA
jgi:hypothetical protein